MRTVGVLRSAGLMVIDTETTGLDTLTAGLAGISLCAGADRAWYVPLGHLNEHGYLCPGPLDQAGAPERLRPTPEDRELQNTGHKLTFY